MTTIQQPLFMVDNTLPFQDTWTTFYGPIAWTGNIGSYIWFNSPGSVEYSWTVPNKFY